MTFEEYKNKMDQITEMQCKSNDQTEFQRIRNENQYYDVNQVRRNLESVIRRIRYK